MKPEEEINLLHSSAMLCVNTQLPREMMQLVQHSLLGAENYLQPSLIKENGDDVEDDQLDTGLRDSSNAWINPEHWLCGMCWHYVMQANRDKWKFDLDPLEHPFQFTEYQVGQYYKWHVDSAAPGHFEKQRKLSFSLQLSDSDEYTGGDLQLVHPADLSVVTAPREYGTMIVFASGTTHQVTPVESGKRKALVGWITGPSFR